MKIPTTPHPPHLTSDFVVEEVQLGEHVQVTDRLGDVACACTPGGSGELC